MQCLPALILVSGKRNSSGISLQRVTGQTESEFFGGSRVVPMGEREREKARYIVAVPTGTNKQNFSFFWRNPKSQKRSGEPARDGFSVDRPSIRLGFGFALPPSLPPSVVSLCVAHSNYAFSDAHRSHRTFGVLFVEWKGARINE